MSFALTAPIEDSPLSVAIPETRQRIDSPATDVQARPLTHRFRFPEAAFTVQLWDERSAPACAAHLVQEAYARLGYLSTERTAHDPHTDSVTLNAIQAGTTSGTLTINFDTPRGLQAEALYRDEVAALRADGQVCEFTRLALDRRSAGREVLCALFYMAYVYAYRIKGVGNLVIEVNPRHEAFYARMLGFRRLGGEKICPRVCAPAVLMYLDFAHTSAQIQKAREDERFASAALYRYAPTAREEGVLVRKMRLNAL